MFFPEEMIEVELIVPEENAVAVTNMLAEEGVFHQVDASYVKSNGGAGPAGAAGDWQQRASAFAALERKLLSIMDILGLEEGTPPTDSDAITDVESVRPAVERLEKQVQDVAGDLEAEQKRREQLQSYIQQLEPIKQVAVPVNLMRHPSYVFSVLGLIPEDHLARLETSLAHIPFVLVTLWKDNQRAVVVLAGMQQHADVLDRAARSAYLNPLNLPDEYQGTPQQIIDTLQAEIAQMHQQAVEREGAISELRKQRQEQLQTLLWRVRTGRLLADALARVGRLHYTCLIVGWLPAARLDALTQQLKQVTDDVLVETTPVSRSRAGRDVPVALKSPGILGAFRLLVTIYGRPRYEEIDPTIFIAITFPLLFGAMFGDVGHGLLLALLGGLLASRKVRALRGLADLGTVIIICGLVAAVFGLLYGSVFGVEGILPALWLHPLDNIMGILTTTIGAGVVLLSLGFILGIINACVARDWGALIVGHNGIAGATLYWSLLGIALQLILGKQVIPIPVLIVLAAVAGLAVMFSEALQNLIDGRRPLIEGGVVTYVVQAIFEMADTLISILSNSLSYVRVGAFAVAHAGLSAVFFILAGMVGPTYGIGYWIIVVLGNVFIIGFEGVIVGIQTLRLEYYEFFSKFFKGGGLQYAPLVSLSKRGGE
jgi:V/A-type H+-transporting ATPase subunit I